MKQKLFILLILISSITAGAQSLSPLEWHVRANKKSADLYEISLNGVIQPGWYLYASNDPSTGLEAVKISFSATNITQRELKSLLPPETVYDHVFSKNQKVFKGHISFTQEIRLATPLDFLDMNIYAFASDRNTFLAIDTTIKILLNTSGQSSEMSTRLTKVDLSNPLSSCGSKTQPEKGLGAVFILGILGGLLALFTPCVFPMVPVTVSFFTNKYINRKTSLINGIVYGFLIFMIYLLASLPFHLLGGIHPGIFNTISTNPWLNVFFAIIFILFALSFFGLFDIQLPSFLSNTTGTKAGIFFMALTLAIVSFSCTGPILGSLLVSSLSVTGDPWQLSAGMAGFGFALGLPFALFAIFPSWLKALPKSGGWMNVVKKSLAFVELALAMKFLSNADLVQHWGLLKREVFIAIWFLIALGLAVYLFGAFEKSKPALYPENKFAFRTWFAPRRALGFIALIFAIYLLSGLTPKAPSDLKLLSGFPPPVTYSIYKKQHQKSTLAPDVVNNFEKARSLSKKHNKPMLIDFTGWACVNCRKMEEHVWTKPDIKTLIENNFILVSLYVDDREKLDNGTTIGKKWADFQSRNFGQVTQPLYVLLSPDERLINHPVGYTPDEATYKNWLQCGLNAFRSRNNSAQPDNN